MTKASQFLEMIKGFYDKSLVGRKFKLRAGYDIEVVAQQGQLVTANKLVDGKKSGDIRKYKLDHLQYLILQEI